MSSLVKNIKSYNCISTLKMRTRGAKFVFFLILVLFVIALIFRWQEPVRKEVLDRNPKELIYTKHALCRMDCRQISKMILMKSLKKVSSISTEVTEGSHPVLFTQYRLALVAENI
jgi:hypothetical protein